MRKNEWSLILVVLLLACCSTSICADVPVIPCPGISSQPTIDGKLDDAFWQNATWLSDSVVSDGSSNSPERTEFFIATTADSLYIAAKFELKDNRKPLVARGSTVSGSIWDGEDVEVFIESPVDGVIHICSNPASDLFVVRFNDKPIDESKINQAASIGNSEWTWEIKIPLGVIGSGLSGKWSVNLCRTHGYADSSRVFSAYAPTGGSFYVPARFAKLVFNAPAVRMDLTGLKTSVNQFRVIKGDILGTTRSSLKYKISGSESSEKTPQRTISGGDVDSQNSVTIQSEYDGSSFLQFRLMDSTGKLLYASVPVPTGIRDVPSITNRITDSLINAKGLAALHKDRTAYSKAVSMLKTAAELSARLKMLAASSDKVSFSKSISEAEKLLARSENLNFGLWAKSSLRTDSTNAFAVGSASPMVKMQRDIITTKTNSTSIAMESAQNEYESTQVVVIGLNDKTAKLRVSGSNLTSSKGLIPSINWEIGIVKTVKVANKDWPDPIWPNAPFTLSRGDVQVLWASIKVPSSALPGIYKGMISVSGSDGTIVKLPVELTVHSFTLPTRSNLQSSFWVFRGMIEKFFGIKGDASFGLYSKYLDTTLAHRLTPIDASEGSSALLQAWKMPDGSIKFDFSKKDRYLAYCMKRGMTCFNVEDDHWAATNWAQFTAKDWKTGKPVQISLTPWSPEHYDMIREFYAQSLRHYRQKGWAGMAYMQAWDEPGIDPKVTEAINRYYNAARVGWPGLRTLITASATAVPAIKGSIGIWCPLTPNYQRSTALQRRALGEEYWWYVCCAPASPYSNFFIAESALNHRLLFHQTFTYDSDGLLYWGVNHYGGKPEPNGRHYPDVPWDDAGRNGDGYFIYPFKDTCIPSVRLKVMRDGLEDYELLVALRDKLEYAKGLDLLPSAKLDSLEKVLTNARNVGENLIGHPSEQKLLSSRSAVLRALDTLAAAGI